MDTLGIINGIIDERIQAPYYPEFAVNNTYGIKAVNDSVYTNMKAAYYGPGGCRDLIDECSLFSDKSSRASGIICSYASDICREKVESPYYEFSGRGTYDIRYTREDPDPPEYFVDFLNLESTQAALGVNINYTRDSSNEVDSNFESSGDFLFDSFVGDLENLLDNNVRVALFYGDADYICNVRLPFHVSDQAVLMCPQWFGGEAVSIALNYSHSAEFRAANYTPFMVDNVEYGLVRQHANFSFTRIYASGHEIPYYQPKAALEFFRRVLGKKAVSDGIADVVASYGTNGTAATGTTPTKASTSGAPVTSPTGGATATPPSPSKSAGNKRIKMFWRRD